LSTHRCTGWNQTKADKLDWLVGQGSTKTKGTGPVIDRTLGTKGNCAFTVAYFQARLLFLPATIMLWPRRFLPELCL